MVPFTYILVYIYAHTPHTDTHEHIQVYICKHMSPHIHICIRI